VIVGIRSDEEAREAFRRLEGVGRGRGLRGVIIYPQLPKGQEVLLGCSRDPQFGPVVVLGMGGIYTEILKDIALRVAPVTKEEAQAMIRELKAYPILSGARGQTPSDLDALAEAVVRFSRLPFLYPEIKEIDLNPVFLYQKGLLAADVRVIRGGN
jgi:acyl-CoA synthetase (NDP forming)